MAARLFVLSILFTEVLRPACLTGVRGVSVGIGSSHVSKTEILELERSGGLGLRLETEPSGNVVVGRRGVNLKCSAGANQNVSWVRNGVAAPPCGPLRCTQLRNGSLHIHKIIQKRGGRGNKNIANDNVYQIDLYRCIVKNTVGALRSSPTFLQIADLSNEFHESPQDVTVQEGEIVRLSCLIDSIPFPPNITWQHDGQLLLSDHKTKYFMISPGVLYINATKLSDAGLYRCIAINDFLRKPKKSKEAKLHVIQKSKGKKSDVPVLLFPQISYNYQLLIGSDLTLVCAASGFPTFVIWTFISPSEDGTNIKQPRLLVNSTDNMAVLMLKKLNISDAGIYNCSVKSSNMTLQTQSITVDVFIPPSFVKKPVNQVHPNGKTARFECQAEGLPTPQIYWLKDSFNLTANPRENTYIKENNKVELAISSTVPSDSGVYQCVAVNAAGEIWAAGRLKVTTSPQSPSVPTSLHCHATSSHKIFLSWKLPETVASSNVPSYITIHYALAEPGSREDTALPDQNSSFIEIESLEPFTNYTMYVRMWNKYGASNQSTAVRCATAESVPIAAPTVELKAIGGTKLNVSWQPLSKKKAQGYIEEYKLQWRFHNRPSFRVHSLSSSLNHHVLSDLIPGTRYEVRVLARTKKGWPNLRDSQFNWIGVTMPSTDFIQFPFASLMSLDATYINTSTIKVKWKFNEELVVSESNFGSWQLYYQNAAGNTLSTVFLPKNCTEYLFTDLEADVLYTIGLCMINSGELSVCFLRKLDPKQLIDDRTLTDLEGVPTSSTSINITWSVIPFDTEYFYEICYNAVYSTDLELPKCFNTTNITATVYNLKPFTLYQFKVRALYNTSEQGNPHSKIIECYTNEDVPGPVRDVEWFLANITHIRIAWKQPSTLNGVIRNYTVSYIHDPLSTPFEYWTNITVPRSRTTVNLPGLVPNSRYFVEVRAATNAGYGKSSDRIIIYTGNAPKNSTGPLHEESSPPKPVRDQSLGIIIGVSISVCCIVICVSSIYCRRKWEYTQSPKESPQSLKDRVVLRNGNGCCVERNSVSASHHAPTTAPTNEIELAVLCPSSPKIANFHGCRSNGIVESCAKEPLLTSWSINGDNKDLTITENPQHKRRSSTGSNQQLEHELDATRLTSLNHTVASSGNSLNNNFEHSESLSSLQLPSTSTNVGPNG